MRKFLLVLLILILGVVSFSQKYIIDIVIDNIEHWVKNGISYHNFDGGINYFRKDNPLQFYYSKDYGYINLTVKKDILNGLYNFFLSDDFKFDKYFINGFIENYDTLVSKAEEDENGNLISPYITFEDFGGGGYNIEIKYKVIDKYKTIIIYDKN